MRKERTKPYARDTTVYLISPEEKAELWRQIVEAAKVVIAKGGGNIPITTRLEDSEYMLREEKKRRQQERKNDGKEQ